MFLKDGKYTFFWTISVIVILVLSLGIFCLPGCRREETHERQKNKMVSKIQEIERQIDAEHGLYGALRWQYNHAPEESSRQKVEIYKELSNRMSKILDLQKRRDSLIQLKDHFGNESIQLENNWNGRNLLLTHLQDYVDRVQKGADRADEASWRFMTFILTGGTLFVAMLGVWTWSKKRDFDKECQKNINDFQNQARKQSEVLQRAEAFSKCIAMHLDGDMFRLRNVCDRAQEKYRKALELLKQLLKEGEINDQYIHEQTIILNKLGDISMGYGLFKEASGYYQRSREAAQALVCKDSNNVEWQRDLILAYRKIGDVAFQQGIFGEAEGWYKESINTPFSYGRKKK